MRRFARDVGRLAGVVRPALLAASVVAAVAAIPAPAAAQTVASERIVAVVGNEVILLSELEEQTILAAADQGVDPSDAAAMARLRQGILDQMIADLVVVAAASEDDSVQVSESQVSEAMEAELDQIRSRFPSQTDFEREIARSQWRTLDNYRKNLRRIKRRELLAQAYLARRAATAPVANVTDEEVRKYFEENRARFGTKPATVTISHLNLLVAASEPAREAARARADSILGEIRAGASFAAVAREASADSASAERGGDLGYFGRGVMVGPFEDAAFGLDTLGQIAGPVETPFGFHVIRLDDRQGDEIKARHILIQPELTEADRAATRALGQSLVDSLGAGVDFDSLRARHSNAPLTEPETGPVAQLPPAWQSALHDLPVGGTTGLLETPTGFTILRLIAHGGGEPYTFEELEPRLRSQLAQTRAQSAFVDELRARVPVDIRMPDETAAVRAAPDSAAAAATPTVEPGAPAPVELPQMEGGPVGGTPEQAYTPGDPETQPTQPIVPLDEPAPVADTPIPDSLPQPDVMPPLDDAPPPGGVDATGGVDSSTTTAPAPER